MKRARCLRSSMQRHLSSGRVFLALALLFGPALAAGAQTAVATVPTGTNPQWVAVNPVTIKVYIDNYDSGNVTVIDGGTNSTDGLALTIGDFSTLGVLFVASLEGLTLRGGERLRLGRVEGSAGLKIHGVFTNKSESCGREVRLVERAQ